MAETLQCCVCVLIEPQPRALQVAVRGVDTTRLPFSDPIEPRCSAVGRCHPFPPDDIHHGPNKSHLARSTLAGMGWIQVGLSLGYIVVRFSSS